MKNNSKGVNKIRQPKDTQILKEYHHLDGGTFAVGFFKFDYFQNQEGESFIKYKGIAPQFVLVALERMGYKKRYSNDTEFNFIHVVDDIMKIVSPARMLDDLNELLDAMDSTVRIEYQGAKKGYRKTFLMEHWVRWCSGQFHKNFLQNLPTYDKPLMKDERNKVFVPFLNGIVTVTPGDITLDSYELMEGFCIWYESIIQRDFEPITPTPDNCSYLKFLSNITNGDTERYKAFISGIGYLLHRYNHSALGKAVMLYDEKITDTNTPEGGTGKGLIMQGVRQIRDVAVIDGKNWDISDKFKFQAIQPYTDVVFFDDMRKNFPFDIFFSFITDGVTIEKKYESSFFLSPEDAPKTTISSNAILGGDGTSDIRRQYVLELSDYYSSQIDPNNPTSPIVDEHGMLFTPDWSDWRAFDTFMMQCAQTYLKDGLQPYKTINIAKNKIVQKCGDDFMTWMEDKNLKPNEEYETKTLYHDFKETYYGEDPKFSQRAFTGKIKKYASILGLKHIIHKSNNTSYFMLKKK